MRTLTCLLLAACSTSTAPAPASWGPPDLDAAESCLKTRIWEARAEDWAMRSLQTRALAPGETWPQPLTIYDGVEYRVFACAEDHAADVELLVYTGDGKVAQREEGTGPQADLVVTTEGDAFLVVHARDVPAPVGVSVGLTYK